jgi:hypothetical protein
MTPLTAGERRTARLFFATELTARTLTEADVLGAAGDPINIGTHTDSTPRARAQRTRPSAHQ